MKISAENVKEQSDVYEATDIVIEGEEKIPMDTLYSIASQSAEDDNSLIVITKSLCNGNNLFETCSNNYNNFVNT